MGKKKYKHRARFAYNGIACDIVADTERALGEKIANKKAAIDGDRRIVRGSSTVRHWSEVYLETFREPKCGAAQYESLCYIMERWINRFIGNLPIRDVKKAICQKILNEARGCSKSHIMKINQLLRAMFEEAAEENLIASNPARRLVMPQAENGQRRALAKEERGIFAVLFRDHAHGPWAEFMLMFGPRTGETARVYGRHIDMEGGRVFIDGTKSRASKRWVPIRDDISPRLRGFLAAAARDPFTPLFPMRDGKTPSGKASRRRWWESLQRAYLAVLNEGRPAGLHQPFPPGLVPYCFRHTYATDLTSFGVPLEIKAEYLGHKPDVTEIYTHRSEEAFELGRRIISQAVAHNPAPADGELNGEQIKPV
ncbi:MAG: site-specific integrase [Clostridiales Family XIII bacterium]|jgi:integrase|nr:site-specific integrase [Clostridiales Family XIII bacterium]